MRDKEYTFEVTPKQKSIKLYTRPQIKKAVRQALEYYRYDVQVSPSDVLVDVMDCLDALEVIEHVTEVQL